MRKTNTMAIMKEPYSVRTSRAGSEIPGVGHYNISKSIDFTSSKMPSIKFGTSNRVFIDENSNHPGPGTHEMLESSLHMRHKSPRATIG